MTDTQLYLAVGVPMIAWLVSFVLNLILISGIREDVREIRSDIKIITGKLAEVDTRLSIMEDRMK